MVINIVIHHRARAGVMRRAALACLLLVLSAFFTCHKVNLIAQPQAPARPVIAAGVEVDDTCSVSVSSANDSTVVAMRLAWGDGDTTAWLPDSAGDSVAAAHVWYWSSAFVVRAQARNPQGVLSEWSEPCTVSVTGLPPFADSLIASTYVDEYAWKMVLQPGGEKCYFLGCWVDDGDCVLGVRLSDMVVTDSIVLPGLGTAICCSPDGKYLYVGWEQELGDSGGVVKVRTSDNAVTATTMLADSPDGLSVTPDNSQVWVVNADHYQLLVRSASDLSAVDTIDVLSDPIALVFDSSAVFAYVAYDGSAALTFVDVARREVVSSIPLEADMAWDIEYSRALNRTYVAVFGDSCNYVSIAPDQQEVDFSFYVIYPTFQWLAPAPDGQWLYLASDEASAVAVVRPGESRARAFVVVADSTEEWLYTLDVATTPDGGLLVLDDIGMLRRYGPSTGVGAARASYVRTRRAAR